MPKAVDLSTLPPERTWGKWRRLCEDVPAGKALDITDLKPDDVPAHQYQTAYSTAARRYGCKIRTGQGRLYLVRVEVSG